MDEEGVSNWIYHLELEQRVKDSIIFNFSSFFIYGTSEVNVLVWKQLSNILGI
jgi:hypothetical protein